MEGRKMPRLAQRQQILTNNPAPASPGQTNNN
jgi:hypothetical protein